MDAIGEIDCPIVACIKGSQVGWTEVILNAIGYYISCDPGPILVINPTKDLAEVFSKTRLDPMIRDSVTLGAHVSTIKSRDGDNTIYEKNFTGGHLSLIGANAPGNLASRPIRLVLADEVDRYPRSSGKEGDPISLARKRQLTFWNRKFLMGSSPTIKGVSRIELEFSLSDQRRYFVPCHACGAFQYLKWSQVKWSRDENDNHLPNTATYCCEHCGEHWDDIDRVDALERGEWRATKPYTGIAGFHIPGLLSPWQKLSDIVKEFLDAKNDPALLQVFINTVLGETFEERGETVDTGKLSSRKENYTPETIPERVAVLTAGVDVQADRLELQVMGWGAREEAWSIEHKLLLGDPALPEVWKALDEHLLRMYKTEDGRNIHISAAAVDTGGHHAAQVYTFCRSRRKRRVFAVKGASGPRPIWPAKASRAKNKRDIVHIIGVDTAKDAIYSRLRLMEEGPGYVHFPSAPMYDEAFFNQLTSEQVVTRYRDNRPFRVWVLKKGQRNEALDTFVMALAALRSFPFRLDERDKVRPPKPRVKVEMTEQGIKVTTDEIKLDQFKLEDSPPEPDPPKPPDKPVARSSMLRRRMRPVARSNYMAR